jgi:hypothetical protein
LFFFQTFITNMLCFPYASCRPIQAPCCTHNESMYLYPFQSCIIITLFHLQHYSKIKVFLIRVHLCVIFINSEGSINEDLG